PGLAGTLPPEPLPGVDLPDADAAVGTGDEQQVLIRSGVERVDSLIRLEPSEESPVPCTVQGEAVPPIRDNEPARPGEQDGVAGTGVDGPGRCLRRAEAEGQEGRYQGKSTLSRSHTM